MTTALYGGDFLLDNAAALSLEALESFLSGERTLLSPEPISGPFLM